MRCFTEHSETHNKNFKHRRGKMNATLDEIIARKKQKELEAAQLAEKLAKAKKRKELKRRQQNATSSSANSVSSCSTSSTTQQALGSKENKTPNIVSNVTPEVSPDTLKRLKDSHTDPKLLRKAGALVRDSQDPHTPIWVPGFSYPAQYCIRQTRSLSQKLQVDNVDCIDLDDCIFGSQRTKVKVEDGKSDDGSVKSEQSTKSVKRKTGCRSKRRRQSSKHSQTSDNSDCAVKLESADGEGVMQSSCGNIDDVSVSLMDEPAMVNDSVMAPVTQAAPLMGGNCDIAQLQATNSDEMVEPLMPECDDVMPSAQEQPMECSNDTLVHLTQQPTEGDNDRADTPVPCHTESNDVTKPDDSPMPVHQPMGNNDDTMYGLTESMLLLIDASCDQQTGGVTKTCDQEHGDKISPCRFWCEQGNNLNCKVTLCKNYDSSHLHCNAVLKHAIGGTMLPLLRISNIASSTAPDENDSCYVAVQLAGYIVVWLHTCEWIMLSHWPVTDELDLMYFHTLLLTGGVAVCTVTKTGTWRISFVKEDITSLTTQPVTHCVSSSLWHSSVMCCWSSRGEVFMATSYRDKIVIQAVENYSEKVKKQIRLPFDGEVCSLCGVENNATTDDEGVWLFAATPTGITIFDIVNECLLQNVSLSCSDITNSLLPKCLRAIREDCYTFIVLGYEWHKTNNHQVVGWLVAIDNSDDKITPLPIATGHHQTVSYAKLLREYMLPQSSPNCDSFNYQSAIHNDQLVVATTTPSQWLHSWDQFTGEVTNAWTISSDHGSTEYSIQSNSTMLALYGGEEDQGNLYIYKLDGT